ncbi:WXG100 family type VII secretion target [Nocardioides sp. InS609-2]|uniref:WXG100 family type VII secretion target n=1 Tax=Nocardioides sp. InS609-2 TaxID=2760705 RepID=UPI0020BE1DFB|nr:WXG100 family type VII secretion target [Nocardioides sp. InS609-2]
MTISLEYGEISDAAKTVAEGVAPLRDLLTDLSDSIETASAGFKGQAAAGMGEAVMSWFQVAGTLGPILEGYAGALVGVANEHITNDGNQVDRHSHLAARLGGE